MERTPFSNSRIERLLEIERLALLARVMVEAGGSRAGVAAELRRQTGRRITAQRVDRWMVMGTA